MDDNKRRGGCDDVSISSKGRRQKEEATTLFSLLQNEERWEGVEKDGGKGGDDGARATARVWGCMGQRPDTHVRAVLRTGRTDERSGRFAGSRARAITTTTARRVRQSPVAHAPTILPVCTSAHSPNPSSALQLGFVVVVVVEHDAEWLAQDAEGDPEDGVADPVAVELLLELFGDEHERDLEHDS